MLHPCCATNVSTTVCVVCHTNRSEGAERICIRLDGRLDTACYGLTISDVTQRSFAGRQNGDVTS